MEGPNPVFVLYITDYVIMYVNCTIFREIRIHTQVYLSTTDSEYIELSQAICYVLPFMIPIKEILFVIDLQIYTQNLSVIFYKIH